MTKSKHTVVLGASGNPERYSFLAVNKLKKFGHAVTAIGRRPNQINDSPIITGTPLLSDVDTVTLYLNPANQKPYYDYILSLKPHRIIFNPGTENPEPEELAHKKGIKTLEACTLVLLSTGAY